MTDKLHEHLTRRELFGIGNVLAMPVFLGGVKAYAEGPLRPVPEIYQSIGVEPIINCRGTFTIIGGSVERPEVRAAMDAASKYFVQIDELAAGTPRLRPCPHGSTAPPSGAWCRPGAPRD